MESRPDCSTDGDGSIAGIVFAFALWAASRVAGGDSLDRLLLEHLVELGGWVTFISVAIVTVAESQAPRLRLPDGYVYQIVGGNQFAASAVLGAVVSLAIGLPVFTLIGGLPWEVTIVLCFAIGFVIAEAAVGRRFESGRKGAVQAA